jgi:hypothetical protein
MMTLGSLLAHHLETTFEKGAGQPAVLVGLDGLTAAQASWKPSPQRHSIWQIVQHLTRWKRAIYEDWQGRTPDYAQIDREDWPEITGDDAAWAADVEDLKEISKKYKTFLQGLSETDLQRTVPGLGQPLAISILEMATHDIYHGGQIRYVRALQGSSGG